MALIPFKTNSPIIRDKENIPAYDVRMLMYTCMIFFSDCVIMLNAAPILRALKIDSENTTSTQSM